MHRVVLTNTKGEIFFDTLVKPDKDDLIISDRDNRASLATLSKQDAPSMDEMRTEFLRLCHDKTVIGYLVDQKYQDLQIMGAHTKTLDVCLIFNKQGDIAQKPFKDLAEKYINFAYPNKRSRRSPITAMNQARLSMALYLSYMSLKQKQLAQVESGVTSKSRELSKDWKKATFHGDKGDMLSNGSDPEDYIIVRLTEAELKAKVKDYVKEAMRDLVLKLK